MIAPGTAGRSRKAVLDSGAMARTLLTGATGLIGSHLARALLDRGDELRVTVRDRSRWDNLAGLDVEPVSADVLDRRGLRRALKGVDRVFHAAGHTSLRARPEQLFAVNALGTRTVLEECRRAEVERVVYTSSVVAIGPAKHGSTADENQVFSVGGHDIPYVNAMREGEAEALRLAAQGLPVVIVNPAHVLGPGDVYRSSTEIVRKFLRREIPLYVDGALNIVDAADVARGHLLADERGVSGERYILGNRNFTLDRLFADLGRLSGVEPPALKLPTPVALALAEALERVPGRPLLTRTEVRAGSLWWAYRSNKARRELGWTTSPHEETLESTIAWYRSREADALSHPGSRQAIPWRAAGLISRIAGDVAGRLT